MACDSISNLQSKQNKTKKTTWQQNEINNQHKNTPPPWSLQVVGGWIQIPNATKHHKTKEKPNKCLPVLRSGKSESYLAMADGGCCGILYGCALLPEPAGSDSPDELFTTPLRRAEMKPRTKQKNKETGVNDPPITSSGVLNSPAAVGRRRRGHHAVGGGVLFLVHQEVLCAPKTNSVRAKTELVNGSMDLLEPPNCVRECDCLHNRCPCVRDTATRPQTQHICLI